MRNYAPKNDDKEISDNLKNVVKEQSKIEAHEMFMISDAFQCQKCYHHETLWTNMLHMWTGKSRSKLRSHGTSFQERHELFQHLHVERSCF